MTLTHERILKLIFTTICFYIISYGIGLSQNSDVIDGVVIKEHETTLKNPCISYEILDSLSEVDYVSARLTIKYEHYTYGVKTEEIIEKISFEDSLFVQLENNKYLYRVYKLTNHCVLANFWEVLTIEMNDNTLFKLTYSNFIESELSENDLMQGVLVQKLLMFRQMQIENYKNADNTQ